MSKKRNDLSGCKVTMPAGPLSYDVVVWDGHRNALACVHIPSRIPTSIKFKKAIADALKAAIPKEGKP